MVISYNIASVMMVKFIAQDVLGWSLFLEIGFDSAFFGVTNPFLHRFTQQPCNDTQISRLPTGGRIHGKQSTTSEPRRSG